MRFTLFGLTSFFLFTSFALADVCDSPQNLVGNCGFETGLLTPWQAAGVQSSPAFQGVTYGVDAADAYLGNYGAYLGGYGAPVSLQQSFATTPGASYVVSYELAQSPATPSPYTNSFTTVFGGATLSSLVGAPQFGFTKYTVTVLATSALSTLVFSAQDDTGFYSLDDVSVTSAATATPEPAGYGLAGVSLVLLAVLRRGRSVKGEVCRP